MPLPTEILQAFGWSISQHGNRSDERSYSHDLIDMAIQNVEHLPSSQEGDNPKTFPEKYDVTSSLEYQIDFLELNGVKVRGGIKSKLQNIPALLRLLWKSLPPVISHNPMMILNSIGGLILCYLEAFLKIIGAMCVASLKNNWRLVTSDSLLNKLFVFLFPFTLFVCGIGQLFYFIGNTLSSLRYVIDSTVNIIFVGIHFCLECCFGKDEAANHSPPFSVCFNALGKNLLMLLPVGLFVASFFFLPLPSVISGMFMTESVLAQVWAVSSCVTLLSFCAVVSQCLSGGFRACWDAMEGHCFPTQKTPIILPFDDGLDNEMDEIMRGRGDSYATSYTPTGAFSPLTQQSLREKVSQQTMLANSATPGSSMNNTSFNF